MMNTFSPVLPDLQVAGPLAAFGASLRVKELEDQLSAVRASLICAFNQLLDLKDLNTGFHSTRLAEWSVRVAQELGLEESRFADIEVTALLHDIGKIGVPDSILKKPARLTEDEYGLMKKHPEYGWAIVRMFPQFEHVSYYVLHHHESYDGKGYPGGLRGTEIPLGARIISVIDSFDAMVSSRPYRKGLPVEEAIRRLIIASGTMYDSQVVQCFLRIAQNEMQSVFAATGTSTTVAL
jgi:HD-GYP domain-containing protein (c-di-GMP phosphodiesterase class II)